MRTRSKPTESGTRRGGSTIRRFALWACLAWTAGAPAVAPAGERRAAPSPGAAEGRPDSTELVAAGAATLARLAKDAASWSTVVTVNGRPIRIDTLQAPGRRRVTLTVAGDQLVRLVERDGLWYVTERTDRGPRKGKYRVGECPFFFAAAPAYLNRGDLLLVSPALRPLLANFTGGEGGVCNFRVPLTPEGRRQVEGALRQVENLNDRDPDFLGKNPTLRGKVASMKDLLEHGTPVGVDRAGGFLTRFSGSGDSTVEVSDFRWLPKADEAEFDVSGAGWADNSDDPTKGDPARREDWAVIGHAGLVDSAGRGDPDARLVDLGTGRMRRIPFEGDGSMPGCFLPGRGKVVVTGFTDGQFGLYEIDLSTRANRRLAAEDLGGGVVMEPAPSPDGKTLAGVCVDFAAGLNRSRLFLIDVESGRGRAIGQPFDGSSVSWLPDGTGIVFESRREVGLHVPAESTVCRMGLDGRVTKLIGGSSPAVLGKERVLFRQDSADGRHWVWKTCDLGGGDVRTFGDGLRDYAFASPSPGGHRMLMLRKVSDRGTAPFVFDVGATPGRPAVDEPGLWCGARWQ